jgi:hypothetical protein
MQESDLSLQQLWSTGMGFVSWETQPHCCAWPGRDVMYLWHVVQRVCKVLFQPYDGSFDLLVKTACFCRTRIALRAAEKRRLVLRARDIVFPRFVSNHA